MGAQDASQSVARLTDADVPLDAFKSDLRRKKALCSVMPQPESEGLIDDLLGDGEKDDEPECHNDLGFKVDCSHPDAVDRLSEDDDPRRVGHPLGMKPQDDDGSDEPREGAQQSKDDVNYRYAIDQSKSCGTCVNFDGESGCRIVAGLIRAVDTCDMWAPRTKLKSPAFYGRS